MSNFPLLEALAKYERENGTLACILPDEEQAVCDLIMKASRRSSARRELDMVERITNA